MVSSLNKMGTKKDKRIITASEINEFMYCSASWKLQQNGYHPKTTSLEKGIKQHTSLGITLNHLQLQQVHNKKIMFLTIFFIILAVILIILGVIL